MKTKFRNKDGSVTAYGFACGHIMLAENESANWTENGKRVTLEKECGVYHIKAIDWTKRDLAGNEPELRGWNDSANFRVWKSFESLTQAKKVFYAECKRLNLKPSHRMPK